MSINGYALQAEAKRILQEKEGDIAASRPVVPHADRVRFEELAEDFLNDYQVNGKRSLDRAERSVKRLKGCFAEWKASNITTPAVRVYITKRQEAKAGDETINRELAALKRMFSLALQAERLLRQPCILHLAEDNVRTGFYGEAEVLALYEALPTYLKPVALFAYSSVGGSRADPRPDVGPGGPRGRDRAAGPWYY